MAPPCSRACCAGACPFSLGYQVLRNFSTALSRPNTSLIVMVTAIGFNALGDYALIFGHFGMPKLGLAGSGLASACSYTFQLLMMLVVVRLTPTLHKYRIFHHFFPPALGEVRGSVPARHAHRLHDDVRGDAVQRSDAPYGPVRNGADRGPYDRAQRAVDHIHGAARHRHGIDRARRPGCGRERLGGGGAARAIAPC